MKKRLLIVFLVFCIALLIIVISRKTDSTPVVTVVIGEPLSVVIHQQRKVKTDGVMISLSSRSIVELSLDNHTVFLEASRIRVDDISGIVRGVRIELADGDINRVAKSCSALEAWLTSSRIDTNRAAVEITSAALKSHPDWPSVRVLSSESRPFVAVEVCESPASSDHNELYVVRIVVAK